MIFVWGSSGEKKELSEGEFFCPECEQVRAFTMNQNVEKLHVYGIPVNEEKKSDEYVVCKMCESAYEMSVLALDETGVANENSRFLPLSQHESLKDLYETCQGYEKAMSPGSLGCSLLLLTPIVVGIGLYNLDWGGLISIIVAIIAFIAGLNLWDRSTNKAERNTYEEKVKEPLNIKLTQQRIEHSIFRTMLMNDSTLPHLAKQFNKEDTAL